MGERGEGWGRVGQLPDREDTTAVLESDTQTRMH